jgi:hypothetical protein
MYSLHAGQRVGLRDGDVPACAPVDPRPGADDSPAGGTAPPRVCPRGIDAVFEGCMRPADALDTASARAIEIRTDHQGRGLSARMLQAMAICAEHGLHRLIAPVRPSWEERYPTVPIERYAAWRREDGLPFHPWLRVHACGWRRHRLRPGGGRRRLRADLLGRAGGRRRAAWDQAPQLCRRGARRHTRTGRRSRRGWPGHRTRTPTRWDRGVTARWPGRCRHSPVSRCPMRPRSHGCARRTNVERRASERRPRPAHDP